jgi:hypothetical protein
VRGKRILLLMLALALVGAGAAWGASATKDVTLSATVSSTAKLTLDASTITFPGADPDTTSSIPANENGAAVTAKVKTGATSTATLTVEATDHLRSGTDVIPISNVTSTGTNTAGSFFSAGPVTWTKSSPGATVGQGKSGSFAGTFSWFLSNSWTYDIGNYTTTATYTLTAP